MIEDPVDQLGIILELIRKFPSGLSSLEIVEKSGREWNRRTLQRKLAELVKEGMVRREGKGRSTRYFAMNFEKNKGKLIQSEQDLFLSLSKEGEEIAAYVAAAVGSRRPVGYQREFLESYQPNQTFYLQKSEREKLHELGGNLDKGQAIGTFIRNIFDRLLIDLSWNSSRLEGNTYSLLETENLLLDGVEASGKSFLETQMILNHKQTIEFLVDCIDDVQMNSITVRNIHALLSDGLLGNPKACGRIRNIPVGISGTVFHPLEVPQLIEEFLEKILLKASLIEDSFEKSFFVLVHLPYLQPFEDVNKHVARLVSNIPLIKSNFCPLSFVDVPEKKFVEGILGVYELNRVDLLKDVFLWAYKRSTMRYSAIRHSLGSPDPFWVQYRHMIKELVHEVVLRQLNKQEAIQFVHKWTEQHLEKRDQSHFIEMIERELLALHIGNIQRFKISPNQFKAWQSSWATK